MWAMLRNGPSNLEKMDVGSTSIILIYLNHAEVFYKDVKVITEA